jgi:putative ABC transport system substrate-binding protein
VLQSWPARRANEEIGMILRASLLLSAALVCVLAAPMSSHAQTPRVHRVGILWTAPASTLRAPVLKAFLETLDQLGYVEGKNLVIEFRTIEYKVERYPDVAAELVKLEPDVILAPVCGAPLNALRDATRTIPIVVATCTDDMVASGLVVSLARPGGNITGQQKLTPELSAKRLEYLKQVVPGAARVAVLWDPGYSDFAADWRALRQASKELGVTLLPTEATHPDQWEAAFAAMSNARADGLITMQEANIYGFAQRLSDLAQRNRLPAVFPYHVNARTGGLMSYGVNVPDMFRNAARMIDKILRGAKAADVPIEQPTRFELFINLKTAQALGVKIPQSLRLRADEVIE